MLGFMQGRLSPQIDGKIQAFPWPYWRDEFALARQIDLDAMEWTLDQDRLFENPFMTTQGQQEIRELSARYKIAVPSVTGDCFMQAPFWKARDAERAQLLETLARIIEACGRLSVRWLVVPLVDGGSLTSPEAEKSLIDGLATLVPLLRQTGVGIAFESDYPPKRLSDFIAGFPADCFGINYDIGNSASLGFDPDQEIPLLAPRIVNVHVKDRLLGGTTVPLGTGNADLPKVFALLTKAGLRSNYILQTARAQDGNHAGVLAAYRDLVRSYLREA